MGGEAQPEVELSLRGLPADAITVDALARLRLASRRHGRELRFRDASPELRELACFMGLEAVLAPGVDSPRSTGGIGGDSTGRDRSGRDAHGGAG